MQTIAEMFEEQGFRKGQRLMLIRQLSRRFGLLPARLLDQVNGADAEAIEGWADRVLEAGSLEEVFAAD
jgi:hypothetical protein